MTAQPKQKEDGSTGGWSAPSTVFVSQQILCFCIQNVLYPCQVEFALSLEGEASKQGVEAKCREKFPEYKGRRLWYWRTKYTDERWDLIPQNLAQKMRSVSNSWKEKLVRDGLLSEDHPSASAKGPGSSARVVTLPAALQQLVDKQLANIVEGENPAMPRAEPVSLADLSQTLKDLCRQYNDSVQSAQQEAQERHLALTRKGLVGKVDGAAFPVPDLKRYLPYSCWVFT